MLAIAMSLCIGGVVMKSRKDLVTERVSYDDRKYTTKFNALINAPKGKNCGNYWRS